MLGHRDSTNTETGTLSTRSAIRDVSTPEIGADHVTVGEQAAQHGAVAGARQLQLLQAERDDVVEVGVRSEQAEVAQPLSLDGHLAQQELTRRDAARHHARLTVQLRQPPP